MRDLVADGGTILFVGTKKQAQDPIAAATPSKCGMPYVNERWLGGMLTNFETISKRVGKMQEYQRMRDSGEFEAMPRRKRCCSAASSRSSSATSAASATWSSCPRRCS